MPSEGRTAPRPSGRPRYRYVLFRLARTTDRNELIAALRHAGGDQSGAWLTRFDGTVGVLRCRRGSEKTAVRLLEQGLAGEGLAATTLSTSGTIAALERRHRQLVRGQSGR